MDSAPTVAIVGRPNVGKSTLFNSLLEKRLAITTKEAGTTRDRISQRFDCNGYEIILVDTGGLEYGKQENIEADIQAQANLAIEDADLIIFVVDLVNGLTVDDFSAANILRKSKKNIILVGNKADNPEIEKNAYNIYELGFGEPVKLSAIHKMGIDDLKKQIEKKLIELNFQKPTEKVEHTKDTTDICILGKPNAGKSSLVNSLIGTDKVIVSDIAGTTRDVTDTQLTYKDRKYNLIDTAGLRRRGKIERGIEKFSSLRCINAIEKSDIVVILIDGHEGVTSQDCHIAQYALEANKGLILAVNKIDLLEKGEEQRDIIIRRLQKRFSFVPWAPVVFISAKNKRNVKKILEISDEIMVQRKKRVKTAEFNSFMQKITQKHLPASTKIKKPKFMYGSQGETEPPKFILFFKNPKNLHFTYPRYLENKIREEYDFTGTPIILKFKSEVESKETSHQ